MDRETVTAGLETIRLKAGLIRDYPAGLMTKTRARDILAKAEVIARQSEDLEVLQQVEMIRRAAGQILEYTNDTEANIERGITLINLCRRIEKRMDRLNNERRENNTSCA